MVCCCFYAEAEHNRITGRLNWQQFKAFATQHIYNSHTWDYVVAMTKRLNIAIIGSGMAGLTAAYALNRHHHNVTLFESQPQHGLAAHSRVFAGGHIDAPLRVMNPQLWHHTLALAAEVGLSAYQVRTDMACSWLEGAHMGDTWLSTRRRPPLPFPVLADWRFARLLPQLAQGLYQLKQALRQLGQLDSDTSLAQWLQRHPIQPLLWHGCVVPVLLTVCTCDVATLLQWPALPLLRFVDLLLRDAGLYRIHGGTTALATALQPHTTAINGAAVTAVWQQDAHMWVRNSSGLQQMFDHVIVTTPTHACGFLDDHQFQLEKHLLQQLPHTRGELLSHSDASCMPKHPRHWSPLHYSMDRDFQRHSFSVWLNPLEPSLQQQTPVFQTWNPLTPIPDFAVIQHAHLSRAVCTPASMRTVRQLQQLNTQAQRRLWLCGSWSCDGLPILESAVTSALQVCQQLGAPLALTQTITTTTMPNQYETR